MKRALIFTALTILLLLGFSTGTHAYGEGYGSGRHEICVRDFLSEEQKAAFDDIIGQFQSRMLTLRQTMLELREVGSEEAFRAAQAERYQLQEERKEALKEIVPEEFLERFEAGGRHKRHHGWDKGSGGFRANRQQRE